MSRKYLLRSENVALWSRLWIGPHWLPKRDNAAVARSAFNSPCFSVGGSKFDSCPSTPMSVDYGKLLRNGNIMSVCTPGGGDMTV